MRALLKPDIARALGVVLLKPGSELMSLFSQGRVLVEAEPQSMARFPSGRVPDARQPLAEDKSLLPFFTDERVINAAGGLSGLESWLERNVKGCQYPHSDYHHKEHVTMRHPPGAMMLCWHCENQLRDQTTEQLSRIAAGNVVDWIIDTIIARLGYNRERELSRAELCWWAVYEGIADAITEGLAERALRLPVEPFRSVYKESDIVPSVPATSILHQHLKPLPALRPNYLPVESIPDEPVVVLQVDPESPETLFARPKLRRWRNADYLKWVKTQPCACCGQPADDAHHLIGWGQGAIGTKAHDNLVIPLCRKHHIELHNDPAKFERKYGAQPVLIIKMLDRAHALGVLA